MYLFWGIAERKVHTGTLERSHGKCWICQGQSDSGDLRVFTPGHFGSGLGTGDLASIPA